MSARTLDFSSLAGRCVAITGGAGVLGGAFAEAFLRVGAKVALLDLDADAAVSKAAALVEQPGGGCAGWGADVLSRESLQAAKDAVEERWGLIDVLINAAGGNVPAATTACEQFGAEGAGTSFFDLPIDAFERAVQLNLTGTVLPSQLFGEPMARQGRGAILNISSMNAFKPLTRIPAYSAAKCAVSNFTEWLAVHLAPSGVRVNALAPGFFLTEQLRYLAFDEQGNLTPRYEKVLAKVAMHRLGDPEELPGAALFLCSDLASYLTGVTLPVDGGFNASAGV